MTHSKWTTEAECNWLKEWIPLFQETQQNQTTSAFYSNVYEDWDGTFRTPEPTADEIAAAGSVEAAVREKRKAIAKVSTMNSM